ncbi:hypothetical protein GCM10022268_06190 [Sphingomonas cynarae]|uniref:Uncharacterized protein n=1 Tax=Sphingomonas cynarae TaxID=930197 RepID=A0ABP7CZI3_9SPHN
MAAMSDERPTAVDQNAFFADRAMNGGFRQNQSFAQFGATTARTATLPVAKVFPRGILGRGGSNFDGIQGSDCKETP